MNKKLENLHSHSNWLIPTKLHIPMPPVWQIPRSDALHNLDAVFTHRVGLILAPAGYGKSTLLAQWCERVADKPVKLAWLSMDETDADEYTFLSYLLAVIDEHPNPEQVLENKFPQSTGPLLVNRVVAYLLSYVATLSTDIVLILDDYHRADSESICNVVNCLITSMPENFHLLISTRESPQLTINTLKARGDLVVLGIEDMQFTANEVEQFYHKQLPYELSASQSKNIWEKTEGWPLALQTAKLWLNSNSANIDLIDTFSGRLVDISDYLNEQVMNDLPADIQVFLMETAVLDKINGDLVNAVCMIGNGWGIIEGLVRRSLFLLPQDNEGRWYRYHHLFAEFLVERLKRKNPKKLADLYIKAASWHAVSGNLRETIQYYLLAERPDLAAGLIESKGGWKLVFLGKISLLSYFFNTVSEEVVKQHPRLLLANIYLCTKSGNTELARRLLKLWDNQDYSKTGDYLLMVERLVLEQLVSGYVDEPLAVDVINEFQGFINDGKVTDNIVLAILYNFLCVYYFDTCSFIKSREAAILSIQFLEANNCPSSSYHLDLYLGKINLNTGNLKEALRIFKIVLDGVESQYGDDCDVIFISKVLLAEVYYEHNLLSSAEVSLQGSLRHVEQFDGWFDIYAAGYLVESNLIYSQQGVDEALLVLDRAEQTAERRAIKKLTYFSMCQRVNFLTLAERLDAAKLVAGYLTDISASIDNNYLRFMIGIALARLASYSGNGESAREIIAPLLTQSENLGWSLQSIKLLVQQASSYFRDGSLKHGRASLNKALVMASIGDVFRPFLTEGDEFIENIRLAVATGDVLSDGACVFAKRLLSESVAANITHNTFSDPSIQLAISGRELETLHLISDGLANKQIAYQLGISDSTVKFHKKNLYRKLQVNDRAKALSVARKLSLI